MKSLFIGILLLVGSAANASSYSCTVGGEMTGYITFKIDLLDDKSANVVQTPAFIVVQNPAVIVKSGPIVEIAATFSSVSVPGHQKVETGETRFFLDTQSLTLKFLHHPPSEPGLPCTKAN